MSAFEFLFSFYGLLLGLAITEVIGGFARAINERRRRPIGWLTPLLAVLLTLDLMTFWASAWTDLRDVTFTARLLLTASLGPIIYYFAARQLFPDADSDAATLDDHFFRNRWWVLGGVVAANVVSYLPTITEPGVAARTLFNVIYCAPLLAAAVIRQRTIIAVILAGEIAWLLLVLIRGF